MKKVSKYILLLFFLSLLPACGKGCPLIKRHKALPASASTEDKMELVMEWMPSSANLRIYADLYKIQISKLYEKFMKTRGNIIWRYLGTPALNLSSDIGMMSLFMEIKPDEIRGPVLIIQGGFLQDLIVTRIKKEAESESEKLSEETYNEFHIFSESGEEIEEPQSFMTLTDGLMAVGKKENLKWLIDSKKDGHETKMIVSGNEEGRYPIFGALITGEELRDKLPSPLNMIESVDLKANISGDLSARLKIALIKGGNIEKIISTLEALKAIEAIQWLTETETLRTIEKINIFAKDGIVYVEIPEDLRLLTIFMNSYRENDIGAE